MKGSVALTEKYSKSTLPYITLLKYVIQISNECSPWISTPVEPFRHRQRISYECPPWISSPVEFLGTDSGFLVFVLHKLEESWRTNLRKSSAVPNQPDYNEKPWRTNLRYTLAVPNRPNQRKNHGVHICEISPLYLINRIIVIS